MRRGLALAVLFGLALAASCADAPYTLKAPFGLVGGEALSLKAGRLVFKKACFLGEGVRFLAPQLTFDKKQKTLFAEAVHGQALGHPFTAEKLLATEAETRLIGVVFFAGKVRIRAKEARLMDKRVRLFSLVATTPRYRFKAKEGELLDDRFVALGVWASPCREDAVIELEGERAAFSLQDGRLLVEKGAARYYGCTLARPQRLLLDTRRAPKLAFPLRLGYQNGWTVGLVDFPIPQPEEPFGAWQTHGTLLAEGLGGPEPTLTLGVAAPGAQFGVELKNGDAAIRLAAAPFFAERRLGGASYLKLAPRLKAGDLELRPLLGAAQRPSLAMEGVFAGLHARYTLKATLGALRVRYAPFFEGVISPAVAPYATWGGRVEASLGGLTLAYQSRLSLDLGAGALAFEYAPPGDAFSLRYAGFALETERHHDAGWGRASLSYQGERFSAALRYGPSAGRWELGLGYRAPRPKAGLALSPSIGWDLGAGLSRAGLRLDYGDGCLVYTLKMDAVFNPWPDEVAGFSWRLGLDLR